jgi:hypothetical protein
MAGMPAAFSACPRTPASRRRAQGGGKGRPAGNKYAAILSAWAASAVYLIESGEKRGEKRNGIPRLEPSPPKRYARRRLTAFTDWLARERGLRFADYDALWRWSVDDLEGFWGAIWDYFAIPCRDAAYRVLASAPCPARSGSPASA